MSLTDPVTSAPVNVFSSALCPDNVGQAGEGYWCPGSSSACPCAGNSERRLILRVANRIRPCPGNGTIHMCMANRASQIIFSFEVYNPYITNGQVAPVIFVRIAGHSDVLPTVLKTCRPPRPPLIDERGIPINWLRELNAQSKCIADESPECTDPNTDQSTDEWQDTCCIAIAPDRTSTNRCPTSAYILKATMRILPEYQCFEERIVLDPSEPGRPFCGSRDSVPTASICARNASAAFEYANATLRVLLNSLRFDEAVPNTPQWFYGIDIFSETPFTCQGNYSNMCMMLGGEPLPNIWEALGIGGCCSGAWTQFTQGSLPLRLYHLHAFVLAFVFVGVRARAR